MAIRADELPHFTPEQYRALVEAEPDLLAHTELIDGVIYHVSPKSFLHGSTVLWLGAQLETLYPGRAATDVTVEFPSSRWDPDIVVVREGATIEGTYLWPEQLDLVVEVSVTSQARDLGPKLRDYARAGIPRYWVVQPEKDGFMLRHQNPQGEAYGTVERLELPNGYRDLTL